MLDEKYIYRPSSDVNNSNIIMKHV